MCVCVLAHRAYSLLFILDPLLVPLSKHGLSLLPLCLRLPPQLLTEVPTLHLYPPLITPIATVTDT